MSGAEVLTRDDDIDVVGIFAALKRRLWVILLVTLLSGVGLFFFLSSLDPVYDSSARILIKDGNSAFTRATSDVNSQARQGQLDEQAVRSEVEIAGSNNLAFQVIDELDLMNNSTFNKTDKEPGFVDLVFAMLGQSSEKPGDLRNSTLKKFKENLTVYAVEQSRVIVIEFRAKDPKLAQDIVAALSQKYIEFKSSALVNSQQSATDWLDPRITELETVVSRKEAAVADYRASEDLLRSNDNDALLATQQLSQISTELSRLKAQRSSAQAKVAAIRSALESGSSLDTIPDVVESNLVQRLREREVALQSQISDLSVTLLPNHPRMKSLQSQLTNLKRQIRGAAQNIVNSLEGNVSSIREAEADLSKEIVRLKSEAARVDEKLVELRALERESETARNLLAEYRSRSLEAKSRAGLALTDAEIISPATFPIKPAFPKVRLFTLVGMLAAMLLSALCVIAANVLSATAQIRNGEQSIQNRAEPELVTDTGEKLDEAPAVESVSKAEPEIESTMSAEFEVSDNEPGTAEKQITLQQPVAKLEAEVLPSAVAVRYAVSALADLPRARVAIVSPAGKVGSETAWTMARHLAARNRSVIVIEFGTDNAVSSEMLGGTGYPGFFNLVTGAVTANQAIFRDLSSSANVMPAGSLFPPQMLPEPQLISDLVDVVAEAYDFCILDCGDLDVDDVNIIASDDSVAVISCVGASATECNRLEQEFKSDGFVDVLQIKPDSRDADLSRPVAA